MKKLCGFLLGLLIASLFLASCGAPQLQVDEENSQALNSDQVDKIFDISLDTNLSTPASIDGIWERERSGSETEGRFTERIVIDKKSGHMTLAWKFVPGLSSSGETVSGGFVAGVTLPVTWAGDTAKLMSHFSIDVQSNSGTFKVQGSVGDAYVFELSDKSLMMNGDGTFLLKQISARTSF